MDQPDHNILTTLLQVVTELNANVEKLQKEVHDIKKTVDDLTKRLDAIITTSFVDGDMKAHQTWHKSALEKGFLKKLFG